MAKEYRVSIQEDVIAPEETLLDGGSEFSDLEQPISSNVFRFAFWGVMACLLVILGVTMKLSLFDYHAYASLALQNRSANFSVPPPRGLITDVSGQPLVKNVPSFDLVGVSKEVKTLAAQEPGQLESVAKTLGMSVAELTKEIATQSTSTNIFFLKKDLTKDQVLAIQYTNPKGMYVVPDAARVYVDGPAFSQVIGYIGKVSKDDLTKDPYYVSTDIIGRLGIEGEYEEYLRGTHGRIFFGDTTDTTNIDTLAGKNIALNIDADLQRQLWADMKGILASAGLSRGAAVIQDPRTGAVRAMVSFPTFDSNVFVDGLSQQQYQAIFNNPAKPLFNRVISGQYNPGSTIKPLMGLMGLEEKVITPQTTIQDCVDITILNPYNPEVSYKFKNWRVDLGPFNLRRAIANSCNIFFFLNGGGSPISGGKFAGLGAEKIVKYLKDAFVDRVLGIDLAGEEHGFIPTPDWKEENRGQPWYQGDTYNISIGQGDLLVTPLWLNTYISAVANGGTVWQPQVANKVTDGGGATVKQFKPAVLGKLPFSAINLAEVKSDMEETVISGTAGLLKDLPVRAGAKTGTAEVVKGQSINSLFTAFAPLENPELAITVLVEGSASNQGYAIRTAHEVLKWYFAKTASE